MPKVSYTTAKGLYQESGSGVTLPRKFPVVNLTATTRTATAAESGTLFVFDGTACTVTLPQAAVGLQYSFVCGATQAGNAVITTQAADGLAGALIVTTAALNSTNLSTSTSLIDSWAATIDTLTLNGTTTGGVIGSRIDVVAVSALMWQVSGVTIGSGTLATAAS
ncbi:MAG: hypothetical protein HN621_05605 [Porticoccaceae bacterium]|jgi:hypothetical protein|nr:hypothetical protein [Porticoccaceae bacterium]